MPIDRTNPNHIIYGGFEMPDVEVLVDGVWCEGELRAWLRTDDGWTADVQWRREPG